MAIDLHVFSTALKTFFADTGSEAADIVTKGIDPFDPKGGIAKTRANVRRNNYSSIAAKATEGILQFPVLVSSSINYDDAIMVMKACERAYAGFIQVIFSMNADLSDVGANNVSDFIRRFHQNDGLTTTDSAQSPLDKAMKINPADYQVEAYIPNGKIMTQALKEASKPYEDNFNSMKLNDVYQPKRIHQAGTTMNMEGMAPEPPVKGKNHYIVKEAITNIQLTNSDVKKANEMQPTFLSLRVQRGGPAQHRVEYNLILGIKCTLHVIPSDEFISNLVAACEYKGKLFRFIKWTTGEINFIRDFVLNLDIFKKTTKSRAGVNSHWWDALKHRANDAKISKVESTRLLPNTTLVMTREEVDEIRANYGYDLLSPGIAIRVMREYFLLGFVVLSTSDEIVQVLYDGQKGFQTYTFKALERETNESERTLKELLKNRR